MKEHPNDNLIEEFFRRELAPDALLSVSEHLQNCAACRARAPVKAAGVESPALRSAFETDDAALTHLEYEDFKDYLESRAHSAEREIVESHIAVCAVCADELADLRTFRESLQNSPAPKNEAAGEAALVRPARRSFWSRFDFGFMSPPAFAGAAVLLFVAVGIYYFTGGLQNPPAAAPPQAALETPAPVNNAAPAPIETPVRPIAPPLVAAANVAAPNVKASAIEKVEKDFTAGLTTAERQTIEQAFAAEKLPKADVANLRGGESRLLGDNDAVEKISIQTPVGIVSRARRPVFAWRALANAESYRVTVFDENFQTVAASDALTATRWQPAANLPPGRIYVWQIKAVKNGKEIVAPAPPAPEARFKILDAATENALQRLEKSQTASPLALGVLYSRANLKDEARRAFQKAIRQNERSDLARKFLRQLK